MAITRKELDDAGFELSSTPVAWEQFATNADTLVMVTCVPMTSQTYMHIIATSESDAAANQGASDIMTRIKDSKMTLID
jgi:hypothetical protein